jgi:hypothetical protein
LGKNLQIPVPGHRALAKVHDEIIDNFMFFEHLFLKKSHIFKWPVSQTLRQKDDCDVNSLAYWSKRKKHDCVVNFLTDWSKKLTNASARSASTGILQIARPKSWWFRHCYRWQFAFHRDSTPPSGLCSCEKSGHEEKEIRTKNLRDKLTRPSAPSGSTCNLQIASPKSWWYCPSCRWQFAFHRGSTPLKRHCKCEKSVHESTETRRENLGEKLTRPSARSPGTPKRTFGNLLHVCHFKRVFINNKLPIRVVYLTGTQKRNIFFLLLF